MMIKKILMPFITGKGPDFGQLKPLNCRAGDYLLHCQLPGNVHMPTKGREKKPDVVNLRQDMFESMCGQVFNRRCISIGFEWWSYRGLIFQGAMGQLGDLSLNIDVNQTAPTKRLVPNDLLNLESYLRQDFWDYYETEGDGGINWRARERFKNDPFTNGVAPQQYLVQLPDNYEVVDINNVSWLAYYLVGEGTTGTKHSYYWACPLNENFYLTVRFQINFELGDASIRLERMLTDAKKIMSMVELRKE
ncbi:hypothetical protein O5O45_27405 [Hahella aquimaris]|uniref:hypothetical protein n=1 Tax=Hahella sp. HNIBRBA332 TaxID=3015983 RepID=UPI00273BBCA9|nr:hypothetical protein [Hahella sp. HNIBRBA332]WLQ13457.1 hypothetical protein O5O45_27405 [Hahella sp. HNIBRBA332]